MLPSTTVLGIPELLEMVLDHNTPQDLLLWQRVNKAWQAAIQRSPRVQERLFFRIKEICKKVFDIKTCTWFGRKYVVANPFLNFFALTTLESRHIFINSAFDGKASHPTASWRQMYLSSPALTDLEVIMIFKDQWWKEVRNMSVVCHIACETGITIGQFADALKEHIARHTEASELVDCIVCNIR